MDGVEHNAYLAENGLMSLGSMSGMNIYFAPNVGPHGGNCCGRLPVLG